MDFLVKIGFFNSIYPIIIFAFLSVYLFGIIEKHVPKISIFRKPLGSLLAIFVFLSIFILPSIPRYQFEKDTLKDLESQSWIKIVDTTKIGSLTEPLTWFKVPIGIFQVVMPAPQHWGENIFLEIFIKYNENPDNYLERLVEVDCDDKSIIFALPENGTYKYTSKNYLSMKDDEVNLYCNYDWAKEINAMKKSLQ